MRKWGIESWLAFLLPLSLLISWVKIPIASIPVYSPEIVAVGYAAFVFYRAGWRAYLTAWKELDPAVKFSLTLLAIGLVGGVVFAPDRSDALGAVKTWFVAPGLFLWALLARQLRDRWALVAGVIGFAVLEAMIGTATYLAQDLPRLQGTFISPNFYAAAVAPIAVLTASLALRRRWLWVVVGLLVASLLLSQSLGGFLGMAVGFGLLTWLKASPRQRWVLSGVIVILLGTGLFIAKDRFSGPADSSLTARLQIWRTAAYVATLYPVSGGGLRSFGYHYQQNMPILFDDPVEWLVPEPHNLVLAFWIDTGLFGLLGAFGLVLTLLRRNWGQPAALAIAVIIGHGLVDTPFFETTLAFLFWIYIGLLSRPASDDANVA